MAYMRAMQGSPISEGKFQHNLWGIEDNELSGRWDWAQLRTQIAEAWCAQLITGGTYANSIHLTNFRKQRSL